MYQYHGLLQFFEDAVRAAHTIGTRNIFNSRRARASTLNDERGAFGTHDLQSDGLFVEHKVWVFQLRPVVAVWVVFTVFSTLLAGENVFQLFAGGCSLLFRLVFQAAIQNRAWT